MNSNYFSNDEKTKGYENIIDRMENYVKAFTSLGGERNTCFGHDDR